MKFKENKYKKIFLNIASGPYTEIEFTNLDNNIFFIFSKIPQFLLRFFLKKEHLKIINRFKESRANSELLFFNCSKEIKCKKNSIDHILSSHFLEHVYKNELDKILKNYHKILKTNATIHIIVPNLDYQIAEYQKSKSINRADTFIKGLLLSEEKTPTFIYRLFILLGYSGIKHCWMYNKESLSLIIEKIGFKIDNKLKVPSSHVRKNDDDESIHIIAKKI